MIDFFLVNILRFSRRRIAAQFTRVLRDPLKYQQVITGNYLFDYQDTYRNFGAMIHGIVVANSITNIPEMTYVTFNNHGSGTSLNHVSVSKERNQLASKKTNHL